MPELPTMGLLIAGLVWAAVGAGWWWRVRTGRESVPKPALAKNGLILSASLVGFVLFDAIGQMLDGEDVESLWLFLAALLGGLALGFQLAVMRIAEAKRAEAAEEDERAVRKALSESQS